MMHGGVVSSAASTNGGESQVFEAERQRLYYSELVKKQVDTILTPLSIQISAKRLLGETVTRVCT